MRGIPRLQTETVTVVTAARVTDPYSGTDTALDWTATTRTEVPGCSVQPEPGSETINGRDSVVTRWRLRGPATMPVTSLDRVERGGTLYEVAGDVERWPGRLAHTALLLQRVEG